MPDPSPSARLMLVQRARRAFLLRYSIAGAVILLGLLLGLVVPAVRQKPFSVGRVTIAAAVVVLGAWSWTTLMRERLRNKE